MNNLYQHFRKEEHPFVDRILDWIDLVEERHQTIVTPFLDPREQFILQSIANYEQIGIAFCGGYEGAERVRGLLYPTYHEPAENEFQVTALEIRSHNKHSNLKHPDYLGALLNTGIKREKCGDILVHPGLAYVLVTVDMAEYLRLTLNRIGKEPVSCQEIPLSQIGPGHEQWMEGSCTVASLRLDAVICEIFHLSRSKGAGYLTQGHVKHNWKVETRGFQEVAPGDMLSLRSYGRCQLLEVEGMSKRGKIRIRYRRIGI